MVIIVRRAMFATASAVENMVIIPALRYKVDTSWLEDTKQVVVLETGIFCKRACIVKRIRKSMGKDIGIRARDYKILGRGVKVAGNDIYVIDNA